MGEIMISDEPIQHMRKGGSNSRTASNQNPGRRQGASQSRERRENSGHKKTQIEVLDHENPIEQYKQYYHQNQKPQSQLEALPLGEHSLQDSNSDDLFNKLILNLTNNQNLQNEHIKRQFKLDLIKDEEDLHNYKNLLNAMAALFYTNHKMGDVQEMFAGWVQLWRSRHSDAPPAKKQAVRAVPAIEIDTDLANAQYENQATHMLDNLGEHLEEDNIHIEGEEFDSSEGQNQEESEEGEALANEDEVQDAYVKGFVKDLMKVGPFSKQILNYSYPPLLYQRGDDSEEEDEEEIFGEEEEEESQQYDGDDFAMDIMGQELEDLDEHNHDLKQQEHVIDGLFSGDSPDGVENVDISDIQQMINKSSASPGLEDQLDNMDFIRRGPGAVGAAIDRYAEEMEDYELFEGQQFDELEPDEMMRMIEEGEDMDADLAHLLKAKR